MPTLLHQVKVFPALLTSVIITGRLISQRVSREFVFGEM